MTDLLDKWLNHYDPIHRGYTPRGIANAVCATNGWCFPRIGGGYNLYRGTPMIEDIDYSVPVGAAGPEAGQVANFAWWSHAADTEYFYVLRAIGGGGVESVSSAPPVAVAFDAVGTFIGGRPNHPTDLCVSPTSCGRFVLRWSYSTLGEEVSPAEFRVYSDGGSGTMDYEMMVGQAAYHPGQTRFSYTANECLGHGSRRMWVVRAVSVHERDDGNEATVMAVAYAEGPDSPPSLLGECVEGE